MNKGRCQLNKTGKCGNFVKRGGRGSSQIPLLLIFGMTIFFQGFSYMSLHYPLVLCDSILVSFAFPSPIHSSSSYISSSSCCLLTFFPQSPTYYHYYHHTIIFIIYLLLFFSHVAWISTCKGRKMKAARITFAEIGFPFVSRISHFKEGFYFCTKSKRKSLFCHSVILQTTFCSLTDNIKRWKTFSMCHHRTIRLSVN